MRSLIAAAVFAALTAAAAAPASATAVDTAKPAIGEGCRAVLKRDWPEVRKRMAAGWKDVAAALDPIDQACAGDPSVMVLLGSVRAEAELQTGHAAEAADRLSRLDVPADHGLWPTTRWVHLAALEVTGDAERFRAVRDELLAADDRRLSARVGVRKVERFETPVAVVDAYQGDFKQGSFVRHMVFVAAPKNGGMPVTMTLTSDPTAAAIAPGRGEVDFYDLYPCEGHSTLDIVERGKSSPPDYASVKARAEKLFSDAATFKPFAKREQWRYCGFETYMLPGFSPEA